MSERKFKFTVQIKSANSTVTEPRILKAVDAETATVILRSSLAMIYGGGKGNVGWKIIGQPEEVK